MFKSQDFLYALANPVTAAYNQGFAQSFLKLISSRYPAIIPAAERLEGFPAADFKAMGMQFLNSHGVRGGELDLFQASVSRQDLHLLYLGELLSGICVGFDYTVPSAQRNGVPEVGYFTASAPLMQKLIDAGAFVDKAKALKSMDALYGGDPAKSDLGNKYSACFKKDALPVIRLDVKSVSASGAVQLDAVIPQRFITGYGVDFLLWPAATYMAVGDGLMQMLQEGAFELNSLTVNDTGELKSRIITAGGATVISYYETLRDRNPDPGAFSQLVSKHLNRAEASGFGVGYLPVKKQWYVFNLRSSLYGSPVSTLKPELIISITQLKDMFAGLNLDDLMLSPDAIRRLFERRVRSWSRATASAVVPNSTDLPTLKQAREYVLDLFKDVEMDQLVSFMRSHPTAFCGNLPAGANPLDKVNSDLMRETAAFVRLTSGMKRVYSVADGNACTPDWLSAVLKRGPVKIIAQAKKTGSRREYICTKNTELLERTYKPLRYLGYEHPGRALAELIRMVKEGEITSEASFLNRANAAGVDGMLDLTNLTDYATSDDFLAILQEAKATYDAEQAEKDRKPMDPNIVHFRSLLATYRGNYFGSVDVTNVVEVWA